MTHCAALEKLCRVCGRSLVTKTVKAKYPCSDYEESLKTVFGIDTTQDSPDIHPEYFCHACKNVLHRAKTEGYQHRTELFTEWCEHRDGSCNVCQYYDSLRRGGRPRKGQRTPGRPSHNSPRYCSQNILAIAPPSFVLAHHNNPSICEEHQVVDLKELYCPICCDILQSPVELVDCRAVVCAECCCSWLQHCDETSCPCCYSDHLKDFSTVRPASKLVLSLLGGLCVICGECCRHVRMKDYSQHIIIDGGCKTHHNSHPKDSVEEILSRPVTTPLTSVELKLQTKLTRRSLAASPEENVLRIKTGGQVCNYLTTVEKCIIPCC